MTLAPVFNFESQKCVDKYQLSRHNNATLEVQRNCRLNCCQTCSYKIVKYIVLACGLFQRAGRCCLSGEVFPEKYYFCLWGSSDFVCNILKFLRLNFHFWIFLPLYFYVSIFTFKILRLNCYVWISMFSISMQNLFLVFYLIKFF